jgi:hypothetical protein
MLIFYIPWGRNKLHPQIINKISEITELINVIKNE